MHFALATRGTRGNVGPLLAIADVLIARGHRVTFATLGRYQSLVESHGCRFHSLRPDDPPAENASPEAQHKAGGSVRSVLFARVEETYRDLLSATEEADLLAGHHILLPLEMAATKRGIPWVQAYFSPGTMNSVYDPPVIPVLPRLHALQRSSHYIAAGLNALFKRATDSWYQPYRELRAREGFPPETCNYIFDNARSPFLNLALFSPLLGARQPDWNKNTEPSGFPFLAEAFGEEHRGLQQFLVDGPPPLVATLGSSAKMHTRHFFEGSLAAARRLGQRIVLLTGSLPADSFGELDNSFAFALSRAPYDALFPRARVVIHSGAIGATGETLRAGKPMLVVPAGPSDQPDDAFRAVRLGVGRTLSMKKCTAEAVTAALRTLLNDPQYGLRAKSLSEQIQREHGAMRAADLLEQTALASAHTWRSSISGPSAQAVM